ncbi:MAG TPA: hypothetical protein VH599_15360 [Ktedonobacterales bacterium]
MNKKGTGGYGYDTPGMKDHPFPDFQVALRLLSAPPTIGGCHL